MILTCEDEKNQVSIFDVEKRKYNQNNCYNIIITNLLHILPEDLMMEFNML
jgi:hypothetical protein